MFSREGVAGDGPLQVGGDVAAHVEALHLDGCGGDEGISGVSVGESS